MFFLLFLFVLQSVNIKSGAKTSQTVCSVAFKTDNVVWGWGGVGGGGYSFACLRKSVRPTCMEACFLMKLSEGVRSRNNSVVDGTSLRKAEASFSTRGHRWREHLRPLTIVGIVDLWPLQNLACVGGV